MKSPVFVWVNVNNKWTKVPIAEFFKLYGGKP